MIRDGNQLKVVYRLVEVVTCCCRGASVCYELQRFLDFSKWLADGRVSLVSRVLAIPEEDIGMIVT